MVDFSLHLRVPDDHNWLKNWNNLIQNLKILPLWREDSGRTPNTSNTFCRRNFFPIWPTYSALKRPILVKRSNGICILLIFRQIHYIWGKRQFKMDATSTRLIVNNLKGTFWDTLCISLDAMNKRTVSPHTLKEKRLLLRSSCFSHCGR